MFLQVREGFHLRSQTALRIGLIMKVRLDSEVGRHLHQVITRIWTQAPTQVILMIANITKRAIPIPR